MAFQGKLGDVKANLMSVIMAGGRCTLEADEAKSAKLERIETKNWIKFCALG